MSLYVALAMPQIKEKKKEEKKKVGLHFLQVCLESILCSKNGKSSRFPSNCRFTPNIITLRAVDISSLSLVVALCFQALPRLHVISDSLGNDGFHPVTTFL